MVKTPFSKIHQNPNPPSQLTGGDVAGWPAEI